MYLPLQGYADHVKCFFCDGGLRNWEPQDDPWQEHVKWFPRCPFVHMIKGDAFVEEIQQIKSAPQNQMVSTCATLCKEDITKPLYAMETAIS